MFTTPLDMHIPYNGLRWRRLFPGLIRRKLVYLIVNFTFWWVLNMHVALRLFRVRIGGLGHLAIQYAVKLGYTVVAISRGTNKKAYALELGVSSFGTACQWI